MPFVQARLRSRHIDLPHSRGCSAAHHHHSAARAGDLRTALAPNMQRSSYHLRSCFTCTFAAPAWERTEGRDRAICFSAFTYRAEVLQRGRKDPSCWSPCSGFRFDFSLCNITAANPRSCNASPAARATLPWTSQHRPAAAILPRASPRTFTC